MILGVALAFQRGTSFWAFKDARVELLAQGNLVCLVRDGRLLLDQMGRVGLSRERLFAVLRAQRMEQLGEVKRVYLEAGGLWSVYPLPESKPGLSIVPATDEPFEAQERVAGWHACSSCCQAEQRPQEPEGPCRECGSPHWVSAVVESGKRTPAPQQA